MGSESTNSSFSKPLMGRLTIGAPAVCNTARLPLLRVTVRPCSWPNRSGRSLARRSIRCCSRASLSENDLLSRTADSAATGLRPWVWARERTQAEASSVIFP